MAVENIKEIEQILRLPDGTLEAALKDEKPVKVEIPKLEVLTPEELTRRDNNEYVRGKTVAGEQLVKETREKLGLDFQGKTIDNLLDAFKGKVIADAKIEPETKVKQLEEDLSVVKKTLSAKEAEIVDIRTQWKRSDEDREIMDKTLKSIPDNVTIDKADIATIFKANFSPRKDENGKIVVYKGEEVLKDANTRDPLPLERVVADFITERKLVKIEGGRGKGDEGGGAGINNLESFTKEMDIKGVRVNSSEYNKEMMARIKDGTLKI